MTPGSTVTASFARALLDAAVARGADRAALLDGAGLRATDLEDPDHRIPLERFVALMRTGQGLANDPALALHFGESIDVLETSIVGLIGRSCATMIDAFEQMNRYSRLILDIDVGTADRYRMAREPEGVWIVDTRLNPNAFPELTESSFARMVGMSRRLGTPHFVRAIHVTHDAPPYRAEYDRVFQVPVTFASDQNALLTDPAWMTLPPTTTESAVLPPYAFGILIRHAESLLEHLDRHRTVRGRVESALLPLLHRGDARMVTIASHLGLSRQTLFRRLKAEGVTYEKVVDELRHTMALHYLNGKKVSVNQTAYLVGFSEPAAFSRAFKRWTGRSPGRKTNAAS